MKIYQPNIYFFSYVQILKNIGVLYTVCTYKNIIKFPMVLSLWALRAWDFFIFAVSKQKYVSFSDMPKQKGNAACTYQLSKIWKYHKVEIIFPLAANAWLF